MTRQRLCQSSRWVIKVGSSLLTADGQGLDHRLIQHWCAEIATLRNQQCEVVLVSSGSIAEGMARLGIGSRPTNVPTLQAAAAVGQMGLIQAYESGFMQHKIQTAQILLTHEDLANRQRYLNAGATLRTLLDLGVTPIVNENDTVTTDEIRFGDNDTLGALVANLISADVLCILTDQHGLYSSDPRNNPDAQLLERANAGDPAVRALAGPTGSHLGSGGMLSKIIAADRAADSGTTTVIANGREPEILQRLKNGEALGTMLTSEKQPKHARKQWLSNQLKVRGQLHLDAGASKVLQGKGASLLCAGVTKVSGEFKRGELVACLSETGEEIARGLVNYSSSEARQLAGKASEDIEKTLGYRNEPELINRDNLVLVGLRPA